MKLSRLFFVLTLSSVLLTACGSGEADIQDPLVDAELNQIMAAKTRFAVAKIAAPLFSTHDWDSLIGGADGTTLKYDRYGEVDELVFVALPGTVFNVQREIRKETRKGVQTFYFKVTTPDYTGTTPLWVDGRFLDLRDLQPSDEREQFGAAKTLTELRSLEGLPYTWHGSSAEGANDLLDFYPPADPLSARESSDWIFKGFDSLGMLYYASNGQTPLSITDLGQFGDAVEVDFSGIEDDPNNDDPNEVRLKQARLLMSNLRPLDVISMGERVWIVLDRSEVIESRYQSKFAGEVQIGSLLDTLYGLFQKGVLVSNPFQALEDPDTRPFFIRRYADTSTLLRDQLTDDEDDTETSEEADELSDSADEETDESSTEEADTPQESESTE